ncbi:thiol reductant ABC exporter subunit CydD [Nocardioides sp. Kera G14]|uniref:thiol reductant ABC exporter subunit CydD n=1 Tax=Nocardioides sp. Kera G14 TaxID=2884264 RepID=UPI001D105ECE|nr:thiol reductant ABC exporter subunit CydD [Nocardioides sp. Kera G14]UDY22978.1 thiol reductant ABC exporter subunit CydD [Nocardioides sp. Kera G14]
MTPRPTDPAVRRALAPAARPLAVVVGCGIVGALLLIAQAFALSRLILAAIGAGAVLPWAIVVVALFAGRAAVGWVSDVAAAHAAGRVGGDVRRRVMGTLLAGSSESVGAASALATRGAASVEPYLTRYVPALVLAVALPPLVLLAIATQDLWSALVVVLTLPLIPVFGILVGLATRDEAAGQWRAMADLAGHFLDVMRGLPTLVAYRRARAQSAVIGAVTERYRTRTMRTLRIAFASSAVLELVATLSVALVAVTIGLRLASGSVALSAALPVLLLAPEAYWPLRRVGAEFHASAEGLAVFASLPALPPNPALPDTESGVSCRRVPGFLPGEEMTVSPGGTAHGVIRLEHVNVTYPGRVTPALAETSVDISGPGVTALVGPSGCGKSTLLAVLAGELPPTYGAARCGSVTLTDPQWRSQVSWLPQRPVFVAGSVADNLRLASPEATDAELRGVLARVSLDHRITDLDAEVGEDGLDLSAGERARLALARVLLADRPWVLLDEPTAHLDPETERVVADVVEELGRTRGVVLVAHRPALVRLAGRVLDLGREELPVHALVSSDSVAAAEEHDAVVTQSAGDVRATQRQKTPDAAAGGPELDGRNDPIRRGWGWVLEGLASTSGVALTATAGWLIVKASAEPAVLTLLVAIVGVRTFGIARPVLRYAERLVSHDRALRLLAQTRVGVFDALVPLVPGRLPRRRGDVLASVVDDVDVVLDRELRLRVPVRGFMLTGAIATAVTAVIDPLAGVATAALTAGAGTAAFLLARHGARESERQAVAARARISEEVTDAVQAAAELRRWQATDRALTAVSDAGAQAAAATTTSARWLASARALTLLSAGAMVALTAAVLASRGDHSDPVAALLILTPLALAEPLATMADAGAVAARVAAAQQRLDGLLDQPPAVTDPAEPRPITDTTLGIDHPAVTRDGRTVLAGLDLTLTPGQVLAISGPSGSGKSTLAALLMRFLDPSSGRVALGHTDLREAAPDDVRRHVGLVDDDPHLFASTVAENIRFARPGSTDAEVAAALAEAQLGEWIEALPDGLQTRLGDGYAEVSGGERARLAIARSLLADHQVLVLDEPTAHLDTATADRLRDEVLTVMTKSAEMPRSIVWIGHHGHPEGADVRIELEELRR